MRTIEDFISYADKRADSKGNYVYFSVYMLKDCSLEVREGYDFYAVKWDGSTRKALFYNSEETLMVDLPIFVVDFKTNIDPQLSVDRHPLESVFADVLDQVTKGKGSERHGATDGGKGLTFSEQPIMTITRYVGNGYPLGQAMKKLSEVPALMKHKGRDAAYKEILGAIAYAAAAALYLKED